MTAAEFVATYGGFADEAAQLTGLNRWVILTQWALETGFAGPNSGVPFNNLAGIRNDTYPLNSAGFSIYPSLAEFVADYARVLHQQNMASILAAAGQSIEQQFAAFAGGAWVGYDPAANATYAAHLAEVYASSFSPLVVPPSPPSPPVVPPSPSPSSGGLSVAERDFLYQQLVKVGQKVGVPIDAAPWTAPGARTYTVQHGDSLWQIAQDTLGDGSRYHEIEAINAEHGVDVSHLYAGNVIYLPLQ